MTIRFLSKSDAVRQKRSHTEAIMVDSLAVPRESEPVMLPLEEDPNLIFSCFNKESKCEFNMGNYCFPLPCESNSTLNMLFLCL